MQEQSLEIVSSPTLDITYYSSQIINFIVSHFPAILSGFLNIVRNSFGIIVGISIPVSLLILIGIIYSVERLKQIRKKESEIYDAKIDMGYQSVSSSDKENKEIKNKWENIVRHSESQNVNDWKQAIIEADIMLGDLLTKMGYKGESIGEQLKRVAKGDFESLNEAWEAHKVRNQIAHEGNVFTMNQLEARGVINMYRKVFEEFNYI
jgi:hypothetical protein